MRSPEWIGDMVEKWRGGVSNFFIINGNVNDYAVTDILFYDYLNVSLRKGGFSKVIELTISPNAGMNPADVETSIANVVSHLRNPDRTAPIAVVVRNPELIFPNIPDGRAELGKTQDFSAIYDCLVSRDFINSKNALFFISESIYGFNQRFLSTHTRGILYNIDFPNEDVRFQFIKEQFEKYKYLKNSELSPMEFARITAGLTLMGIEDLILQGKINGKLEREIVVERKTELIRKEYGDVLEIMDTERFSFNDFAGQDHLKSYHRAVVVNPMLSGDVEIVPKGILYTGPPGTGKTHFARCLAGEAKMNFVELKPANLKDMWVGNSQKNFAKALNCIRSIVPVGVFIDEIDQVFSRGNDSSGVASDFFSMFLTILSEPQNRGKIIWIAATNYPNKIDEALKRTGRLDKKMPFLPPEEDDRKKVLEIYLNKAKMGHNITQEEMHIIAKRTNGYTQAEIEGITVKTIELAKRKGAGKITINELNQAMDYVVKASSSNIEEMTELAIKECNDLEFMPESHRHRFNR